MHLRTLGGRQIARIQQHQLHLGIATSRLQAGDQATDIGTRQRAQRTSRTLGQLYRRHLRRIGLRTLQIRIHIVFDSTHYSAGVPR